MQSLRASFDEKLGAPPLVVQSIMFLREYGLGREGLFRIATDHQYYQQAQIRMRQDLNSAQDDTTPVRRPSLVIGSPTDESLDKSSTSEDDLEQLVVTDVDDVASILKMFLLDLEDPVITMASFERIKSVTQELEQHHINQSRWRIIVNSVLQSMPEEHKSTLFFVLDFLADVADRSEVNKMTVANLAVVFAPALMRAPPSIAPPSMTDMIAEARLAQKAVALIIEEFANTADEVEAPVTLASVPPAPELTVPREDARSAPVVLTGASKEEQFPRVPPVAGQSVVGKSNVAQEYLAALSPRSSIDNGSEPLAASARTDPVLKPSPRSSIDQGDSTALPTPPLTKTESAPPAVSPSPSCPIARSPSYDAQVLSPPTSTEPIIMQEPLGVAPPMRVKRTEHHMSPTNRLLRSTHASVNNQAAAAAIKARRMKLNEDFAAVMQLVQSSSRRKY